MGFGSEHQSRLIKKFHAAVEGWARCREKCILDLEAIEVAYGRMEQMQEESAKCDFFNDSFLSEYNNLLIHVATKEEQLLKERLEDYQIISRQLASLRGDFERSMTEYYKNPEKAITIESGCFCWSSLTEMVFFTADAFTKEAAFKKTLAVSFSNTAKAFGDFKRAWLEDRFIDAHRIEEIRSKLNCYFEINATLK